MKAILIPLLLSAALAQDSTSNYLLELREVTEIYAPPASAQKTTTKPAARQTKEQQTKEQQQKETTNTEPRKEANVTEKKEESDRIKFLARIFGLLLILAPSLRMSMRIHQTRKNKKKCEHC